MISIRCIFLLIFIVPILGGAQKTIKNLGDVCIMDILGKKNTIQNLVPYEQSIFIFFDSECPICQYYIPKLNDLDSITRENQIPVIAIFSGKYTNDELKKFKNEMGIKFQMYIDKKFMLAKKLGAYVTPEIYLIDLTRNIILYNGLIDDRFASLGKRKSYISNEYFMDAFFSFQKEEDIKVKETKAIGCMLNYK